MLWFDFSYIYPFIHGETLKAQSESTRLRFNKVDWELVSLGITATIRTVSMWKRMHANYPRKGSKLKAKYRLMKELT